VTVKNGETIIFNYFLHLILSNNLIQQNSNSSITLRNKFKVFKILLKLKYFDETEIVWKRKILSKYLLKRKIYFGPGTVACAVILATGTVDIGSLRW
jgi:hypothetical protein